MMAPYDVVGVEVVWPDGEDLAPDVLHGDGIPARLEQSRTTP